MARNSTVMKILRRSSGILKIVTSRVCPKARNGFLMRAGAAIAMFVSPSRKKEKAGVTFPSVEQFLFPGGGWPKGDAPSLVLRYALGGRGFILLRFGFLRGG